MKKHTRWVIIALFGCVVMAYAVVQALLLLGVLPPPQKEFKLKPSPLYEDVKRIRYALLLYQNEHEYYPFDERGPAYALYRLKPYLTNFPGIMPAEIWNHKEQRLDTIPVGYVNEALCSPFEGEKSGRLLLWVPLKDGANLCVLRSGNIGYSYPGEPFGD